MNIFSSEKKVKTVKDKLKVYSPIHVFFNPGHRPIYFSKLYNVSDMDMVKDNMNFESYYVVRKTDKLPHFWEHFTGFWGKNYLGLKI